MNAAVGEVLEKSGIFFPAAHRDYDLMARLARSVQQLTGFENFGLPFCMTVEAEICGSKIDYGSPVCEPKIAKEIFPDAASVVFRDMDWIMEQDRLRTVATATQKLAEYYPDIPVIASLTGPVSLAASVVDPMTFFRDLKRNPEAVHELFTYVSEIIARFAELLIQKGATVIAIADPTATGEILSPAYFSEYAVVYIRKIVDRIHQAGGLSIVHICGNLRPVKDQLEKTGADVISVDAMVGISKLRTSLEKAKTMGNLSTFLLGFGEEAKIETVTRKLIEKQVDIVAPACGLGMATPLRNIQAMTRTVKEGTDIS